MLEKKKKKIVNDPVHGFINIPFSLSFDVIEHPFFQRLRHIRRLGLTYLVYPGANHTRFQHALGAMHLMASAIDVLRAKGLDITHKEAEAATAAILLHDVGHGPFSHSL
ncbi:MAG TPA: phosphohydrolase, partial [Bacteroidales bacterium]|nr:phosphohydrolase [Bacteroidales bacterium]